MIIEHDEILWAFKYENSEEVDDFDDSFFDETVKEYRCDNCKTILTPPYCELINKLDRANLLPDYYKHYCCFCYFFEKIGILHLKKNFNTWTTDGDILLLYFYIIANSPDGRQITIRVHDYERLLLE